ncbi:hypothetical protein GCM10009854_39960 [Saccharopolyspora halophila]|uniref:Transmembrane transport protein n=1 Tax=Saccharopolyspora halophila TaxID=405551 RepID=A0ABN3GPH8_9PSEU
MIWVAWRQHRTHVLAMTALLLLGGGAILALWANMAHHIQSAGLAECLTVESVGGPCQRGREEFQQTWYDTLRLAQFGVLALPVLLGVFSAAPLFARELENGTDVLAFTQSVSRFRWMATKTLMVLVPSLIAVLAMQWLVNGWVAGAGMLGPLRAGTFSFPIVDTTGPMPTAHLLFSFALGALLGAVLRRSVLAMALTLGGLLVLRLTVSNYAEKALPHTRLTSSDAFTPAMRAADVSAPDVKVTGAGYLGPDGRPAELSLNAMRACANQGGQTHVACFERQGIVASYADVIPMSAFPHLQWAEFAIFTAAAALLLAATAWTLRRQR